jgi:hypothetical protein
VLEFLDDVASDMSVFHRIEEVEKMPARRFFSFAVRLPAYSGAVAARLSSLVATQKPATSAAAASCAPAPSGVMPGTRAAIQASEFADLFSWGS